jgi:hypothetical protein
LPITPGVARPECRLALSRFVAAILFAVSFTWGASLSLDGGFKAWVWGSSAEMIFELLDLLVSNDRTVIIVRLEKGLMSAHGHETTLIQQ